VTISEIVFACGGSGDCYRKRARREKWPRLGNGYRFNLDALPIDIRERVQAQRDVRVQSHQIAAADDCNALASAMQRRVQLVLTESQRQIAIARIDLLLRVEEVKAHSGINDKQAILRAIVFAEMNEGCSFRVLLNKGHHGNNAINYENVMRWRGLWKLHRRHDRDRMNYPDLAPKDKGPARMRDPSKRHGDARYWHHIALFYDPENGVELIDAWNLARAKGERHGWGEWPSYLQVQDWYLRTAHRRAMTGRQETPIASAVSP
jgi:hypothetical protein